MLNILNGRSRTVVGVLGSGALIAAAAAVSLTPGCATDGNTDVTLSVRCDPAGVSGVFRATPVFPGMLGTLPSGYVICESYSPAPNVRVCVYCKPGDPLAPQFGSINCVPPYRELSPYVDFGGVYPKCMVDYTSTASIAYDTGAYGGIDPGQGNLSATFSAPFEGDLADPEPFELLLLVDDAPISGGGPVEVNAGAVVHVEGSAAAVTGWLAASGIYGLEFDLHDEEVRIVMDAVLPIASTFVNDECVDVRWIDAAAIRALPPGTLD